MSAAFRGMSVAVGMAVVLTTANAPAAGFFGKLFGKKAEPTPEASSSKSTESSFGEKMEPALMPSDISAPIPGGPPSSSASGSAASPALTPTVFEPGTPPRTGTGTKSSAALPSSAGNGYSATHLPAGITASSTSAMGSLSGSSSRIGGAPGNSSLSAGTSGGTTPGGFSIRGTSVSPAGSSGLSSSRLGSSSSAFSGSASASSPLGSPVGASSAQGYSVGAPSSGLGSSTGASPAPGSSIGASSALGNSMGASPALGSSSSSAFSGSQDGTIGASSISQGASTTGQTNSLYGSPAGSQLSASPDPVTSTGAGANSSRSHGGFWVTPDAQTPHQAPGQIAAYQPEGASSLESLFRNLFAAYDQGKKDVIERAGRQLVLPNPEGWFAETFGQQQAGALSKEYQNVRKMLETDFLGLIKGLETRDQTQVYAVAIRTPADRSANEAQKKALLSMTSAMPLYSAYFFKKGSKSPYQVYSFVYVGGNFRFVGKMQALATPKPLGPAQSTPATAGAASGSGDAAGAGSGAKDAPAAAGDAAAPALSGEASNPSGAATSTIKAPASESAEPLSPGVSRLTGVSSGASPASIGSASQAASQSSSLPPQRSY